MSDTHSDAPEPYSSLLFPSQKVETLALNIAIIAFFVAVSCIALSTSEPTKQDIFHNPALAR